MEIVGAVLGFVQLLSEYDVLCCYVLQACRRLKRLPVPPIRIPSMYLFFLLLPSEKVECLSAKLPCGYLIASSWVTFGGIWDLWFWSVPIRQGSSLTCVDRGFLHTLDLLECPDSKW